MADFSEKFPPYYGSGGVFSEITPHHKAADFSEIFLPYYGSGGVFSEFSPQHKVAGFSERLVPYYRDFRDFRGAGVTSWTSSPNMRH